MMQKAGDQMSDDDDDITRHYHRDNPRSAEANPSERAKSRDCNRIRVFLFHRQRHGAICEEAERALNMIHETCSARFSELKRDGEIIVIGWRLTSRGNKADVCILRQFATPEEIAAFDQRRSRRRREYVANDHAL
jgi:hypothetical protein